MNKNYLKMNNRGLSYFKKKKYKKAFKQYSLITRFFPNHYLAWFNLGLSAQLSHHIVTSEKAFKKAISLKEDDAPSQNELGLVYFNTGRIEKAKKRITNAVKLDPNNPIFLNNLGVIYFNMNEYEKAAQQFNSAITIDKEYKDCWFNLKDCYEKLGDERKKEKAVQMYEQL